MVPTSNITDQLNLLLATDTNTLNQPADANKVFLVDAEFTPGPSLIPADLSFTSLTGGGPISAVLGAQNDSVDPLTGDLLVEIKPPAGGWRWEFSAGTFPTTLWGYALLDNDETRVFGAARFDTPIILTAAGQSLTVGAVVFRINAAAVS